MRDPLAASIGKRLRQIREDRGLTVVEMAALTGIPQPTLEQHLAGRSAPRAAALKVLSDALFVSIDWIVAGERFETRRFQ